MEKCSKVKIKEIFTSIQGEGPYVGQKHIFVRFSKCNLNCKYCDTDFRNNLKEYNETELFDYLYNINCKTISFTGGEPLLEIDFLNSFLKKYYKKLNKKIYLETNGTLYNSLNKIIDYVDIVAMDIKLKSASKEENKFFENEEFLKIASKKEVFIKIVFDENILKSEIEKITDIAKKFNTLIALQPKMPIVENNIQYVFDEFYSRYENVRLIPQVHKFLNIE